MNFTVRWERAALRQLTSVWLQATDRNAVTAAQALTDQLLRRDPFGNGRHLSEGLYRLDVPPIAVYYTIDLLAQSVEITTIRALP